MKRETSYTWQAVFPSCRSRMGSTQWQAVLSFCGDGPDLEAFLAALRREAKAGLPGFLPDLARIEWGLHRLRTEDAQLPENIPALMVNPSVQVLELDWTGLAGLLDRSARSIDPAEGAERVLLWLDPGSREAKARPATDEDLLVLKMTIEQVPAEAVAAAGNLPVGAVDAALERAVRKGLLLAPPPRIRRDPAAFSGKADGDGGLLVSPSFTLQWHITQVCDLHCKHCYDRSDRSPLEYDEAVRVLDDLRSFCRDRSVQGAVSFTGGNPLLHPRFLEIYRAAAERNFGLAILGNPAPRERIEEILSVAMPSFFQVSLEGLAEHNDSIRGAGHFERTLVFLDLLRSLNISSMVMLTLTNANRDQVLPLAGVLRNRTDVFHFNRLALFGEGANLAMADRDRYRRFLEEYLAAARENPVLGLKDNLINILRHERGEELFGGCTGYGCGAAFNFVTLLADGEVHACRKLPSPIGKIREQSLSEIYGSEAAQRYRRGPSACAGCAIRAACRGCLAVAKSSGLDIFVEKDPFCFFPQTPAPQPRTPG